MDKYKLDRKEYKRVYRQNHKEEINAYSRSYYQRYKINNRDRINHWGKTSNVKAKQEVLSYYSNGRLSCACCGENNIEFLGVDHINGGGNKHRKTFSGSICKWLKARGFPDGYRVLCHNCNLARGFYGYCPHEKGAMVSV